MSKQQNKRQAPVSEKDRLANAMAKKVEDVTIEGRTLHIYKWNYWTSIKLSARLVDIVKKVLMNIRDSAPSGALTLMQMDVSGLLQEHAGDVLEITAETIARENFDSVDEAKSWIEEDLGFAEVADIFVTIARQNLRPFGKVFRSAVGLVRAARGQQAPPQQTSSPSSSKEATPTKQ